ncbi:MAG: hypothetical protein JWM14_2130 [Chitinophagaceae bacterium]|nr:hypothetical protein [Chitinophagaceae bacterium]
MLTDSIRHLLHTDQGKRNSTLVLFILTGFVCLLLSVNKPLGDYANYYYGSTFAVQHVSAQEIYEPIAFNQRIRAEGEQGIFANYAPVPPFSLIFYIPFVIVKADLSKFIFGLLGLWLCTISLYRLLRYYPIRHYGVLFLPLVLFIPLKSNLNLGQSYLFILSFLIEGFIFSNREKGTLPSAVFFSLAIALKIFPAVILIYLFFTGKRKIVVYTIAFTALWFVLSIPLTGTEQFVDYLTQSLPRLFSGEINDPYSSSYQSVTVLLKKLFVPDALLNAHSWFDATTVFIALNIFFSAIVLTFCIKVCRSYSFDHLFRFGFTLFCGLLISGYGTSYTLLLLLFLFIPLMSKDTTMNIKSYWYTALLIFIAAFPIHWFFGQPLLLQFIRLYGMLILFFTLVYFHRVSFSYTVFFSALFLLTLPAVLNYFVKKDNSIYYTTAAPSLLLYEYHQESQGIRIGYYDERGTHDFFHPTKDTLYADKNLEVKNEHLYYKGQALTFGNNKNKSPLLLNSNEVIYLSDKGRGIGLYALRKIKLP